MSTSGSWDFSLTAAQIMQAAAEDLGVLRPGQTMPTAMSASMLRRLNMLAKQWQGGADGMGGVKVHTRQRVTLFLAKGQQTYLIGPAATDARATTQYGRTTISANEAASQTTLSITATTDTTTYPGTTITMTNADIIGIQLDSGAIHWSTISGTPAGTVTINDALASTATSGNYVWWFTSRAQRFPVIESAVLRNVSLGDVPLIVYNEVSEYEMGVADKYGDGQPSCILIEPLRLNTRVTLNRQPTDVTSQIILTVQYPSEDYDATTNDIAYPQEWLRPLAWELSHEVAPAFSVAWTPNMESNRQESLKIARSLNPERSIAYFQPEAPYWSN